VLLRRIFFLPGFRKAVRCPAHGLRHPARLGVFCAIHLFAAGDTLSQEVSLSAKTRHFLRPRTPRRGGARIREASAEKLQQHGHMVDWHEYAMPHSVTAAEIDDIEHWLAQKLV
jgi:phospholipase/carboxylesterase